MNPDEVVAMGAAVQGGVLAGDVEGILLLDVTPLSLGVETMGGVMTKMIDRNTTIPTRKTEIYSTAADNQTSVEVHVLQGERQMAGDNKTLGKFQLTGIPAARRGVPQIEVTFDIDANGIVNVSAKDLGTGKQQQITISGSTALNDDEVERMVKDAEAHAEEDAKRKEEIEVRNNADALVNATEQTLQEVGDKAPADVKSAAEEAIAEAKQALEGSDIDAIKAATEKMQQAGYKLAEVVYSTQGPDAAARPLPPSPPRPTTPSKPTTRSYDEDDKKEGKYAMAKPSTPSPGRSAQGAGKSIPIEDDADAKAQPRPSPPTRAAHPPPPPSPLPPREAAGRRPIRAIEAEVIEDEPAPRPTSRWLRRRPRPRIGRTSTCACTPSGTRTAAAPPSSARSRRRARRRSWSPACCPSSTTSSAPSTTRRRTAKAACSTA